MTLRLERRLSSDVAFNISYTLSYSKDDASSPGPTESEANVPQDVRNIFDETGEWAFSSFDHRHQFIASGVYQLPFFRDSSGSAKAIGADWRVNAVFVAQSGAPFTVNLGVDHANIGAGPAQRPDELRSPNLPGNERTPDRWFDTAAFALPAQSPSGPRRATVSSAPASRTWISHGKDMACGGSLDLEFRWEIFNLFNRTNFDLPNRIFGSPTFGRIFSAKNPREMQFGLRLSF
jgi:hypothetical protein